MNTGGIAFINRQIKLRVALCQNGDNTLLKIVQTIIEKPSTQCHPQALPFGNTPPPIFHGNRTFWQLQNLPYSENPSGIFLFSQLTKDSEVSFAFLIPRTKKIDNSQIGSMG